ncbi:integrase [Bifidobacterium margollesii]|uniref:Integrase n=1 Tax=Bifidobacterium margollesii TaxID=2020964 RepID=A0A2N5J9N5_9BIFI|nr:site-specific integrase [Bifidobacterium margollesii]PLS30929.1 integrase [Bifidobacterium margollesii]
MTRRPRSKRRDNGTGTLIRLDNGRWRAFVNMEPDPDGNRRRVSATGATRSEALNRARAKADDQRRLDGATTADMPTVGEWCRTWVETIVRPRKSPNTYRVYEQRIRCGIIPAIGTIRLDRLRPSHALDLERRELRRHAAATARLTHVVLKEACDAAVRERLIDVNPLYAMEPVAQDVVSRPILDPEQAARVIRMEPDAQWRLIWRLLLTCGMRVGELGAITPESVVEQRGVICLEITWQLKNFPHVADRSDLPRGFEARHVVGHYWLTRPKTRAGFRLIGSVRPSTTPDPDRTPAS